MLRKLELDLNGYSKIIKLCEELNIDFMSTPFDLESARPSDSRLSGSIQSTPDFHRKVPYKVEHMQANDTRISKPLSM